MEIFILLALFLGGHVLTDYLKFKTIDKRLRVVEAKLGINEQKTS